MGLPPGKYLENLRLTRAHRMVASGAGLKRVARETGPCTARPEAVSGVRCGQLERGHRLHQFAGLALEAAGGRCDLFDHGGVLLRRLVHLGDGRTHLSHCTTLLAAGRADLAHDVGDTSDALHHL
eukprot:gene35546-58517_t